MRRALYAALLILGAFATVAAGLAVWLYGSFQRPYPDGKAATVVVPRGAGVDEIAQLLAQNGVIQDKIVFSLGVRLTEMAGRLRAGEYAFPAGASPRAIMDQMVAGKVVMHRLTIPEGLTTSQIIALIDKADALSGSVTDKPGEGALMPDTYYYVRSETREALVARMEKAMREALDSLWAQRKPETLLESPEQALILASLVEGETGVADERPMVAGVFVNRLRRNMKLQSDVTVAYGVAKREGRPGTVLSRPLNRQDLATPDPYNTYLNEGLPPGPINNPGRSAIAAAINPASTDALYFVADGTGGHTFSRTLDEHNRAVARLRQIERERARQTPASTKP
jgi:UPF0755 protein